MHSSVSAFVGREHLMKSARIRSPAPGVVVPQILLAAIAPSLSANNPQESPHRGRAAFPARPHAATELCTISLQRNEVVYLA